MKFPEQEFPLFLFCSVVRIFCASDEMACATLLPGNHKKGDFIAECHRIFCDVQSLESSIVLETDEFGPCIVGLRASESGMLFSMHTFCIFSCEGFHFDVVN
jgi:hypothetical protein